MASATVGACLVSAIAVPIPSDDVHLHAGLKAGNPESIDLGPALIETSAVRYAMHLSSEGQR